MERLLGHATHQSGAAVPVHATAFRPVTRGDLAHNPFRVFTSLLRLELIVDADLREKAKATLSSRQIFSNSAVALTKKAETDNGSGATDAATFVT